MRNGVPPPGAACESRPLIERKAAPTYRKRNTLQKSQKADLIASAHAGLRRYTSARTAPSDESGNAALVRCERFGAVPAHPARAPRRNRAFLHKRQAHPGAGGFCTPGACPEKLTRNGLLVFPAHVVRIPGGTLRFVRFHSNRSVARCTPIRMSVHGPNTHSKDRTHVRMRHRRL